MKELRFAKLSITMAAVYQLLLLILIILRPDLPPYSTTISEWAIGKFGWLMQIAFCSSALGYLFLFLAVRKEIKGKYGKTGLFLLFICFIGTMGVGIFVSDPYPPDFTITTTIIHTISGTAAMVLLPFAALLINRNIAKQNNDWLQVKSILKWTAFLPLIVFIGCVIHLNLFVIPLGENAVGENVPIGYPPRILFLSYDVWLIILSFQIIKIKKITSYDT